MEQDVSCGNFDLGLAGGGVIGADLALKQMLDPEFRVD